ncbi:LysR family transcriptional regulator [Papillibacter cinnamivorans]|uniref:DNA-binding transcriptional regulator, LysR family n=1 Tax=Papillibacter cinnamivorans DSM 12816 TaxID=1122930 RepID=A0A1W2AXI2_9FIRM|nr:LysR family transcriptional regulator [Papillibacter cinnamivorans]SMC65393.1 DNA-binding transcriptional regulator, LysR family [Papillibacter cinnamivorans DSM 12816]
MSIQKYTAFVKTAECGSFTKSAELLGYSQSGISRMIGDLEAEWGVSLLDRSRSGVCLTSDGLRLLPHAQSICNEYRKLRMEVDELHGLQSGIIRVGTFSSVATHWLPNMIKEFQKSCPNIDYELLLGDYTEIEQWILDGRVDCGFLILPVKAELETIFLEQDRLLAVLPADHPLAGCEKFPVAALCGDPFMLLEKGGKTEISEIFEQNGISPQIRFTTWDDYAIMSMVESGLGISILPELILQRIPYRIAVKELDVPAYRSIGLAMKSQKTASVAVKRFLEYLPYRHKTAE